MYAAKRRINRQHNKETLPYNYSAIRGELNCRNAAHLNENGSRGPSMASSWLEARKKGRGKLKAASIRSACLTKRDCTFY